MNVSRVFYFFNFLFVLNLIIPLLVKGKEDINNVSSVQEIDEELRKKKKKKKIILYSLLAAGLIASTAVISVVVRNYIKEKKEEQALLDDLKEYISRYEKPIKLSTPQPSTSGVAKPKKHSSRLPKLSNKSSETGPVINNNANDIYPQYTNTLLLNKPLIKNMNETDLSKKRYNTFLNNSRVAIQKHFESLSDPEKASHVYDKIYMRKVIQNLASKKNIQLSSKQEDSAVLDLEYHLQKCYANYLSNKKKKSF